MAPSSTETMTATETEDGFPKLVAPQAAPRKYDIVYPSVLTFAFGHIAALYGLYLACTVATWKTLMFQVLMWHLGGMGITAGAHRLWTHRTFKAKMPLQIILMVLNSMLYQYTVVHWVRDHRQHHRYTDTDADPYNATRGFFFSHIGWLLVKKHPEVIRRKKLIDMSDIQANPVLMFQKKYAFPVIGIIGFVIPTLIPMYFFGESLNTAWHVNIFRYVSNLHFTCAVNSVAHLWGNKPYDKNIMPVQNLAVSFFAFGEGFHNYHHAFPWDYRTAELGNNWLNFTTLFIDFWTWVGWAYDLKSVSVEDAQARAHRTGDGSNMWGFKRDKSE